MTEAPSLDPQEAWSVYEADAAHPWDRRRAARLLRRAGFAPTLAQIDAAVEAGPGAAVDRLLDARPAAELTSELDGVVAAALAANDARRLAAAWLLRLVRSPDSATEKLVLFWHGHFATSAAKVTDPRLMHRQHQEFRRHAFGPFDRLTLAMARDPAMLLYLDSATNRRTRPNENFARELMELFCLGLGAYDEHDVQELARCFTGWEVHQGKFRFYAAQHDRGEKRLLGRQGPFDGEQAVQLVLDQPAAGRFLARKLIRLYLCDEPELPDAVVQPLADQLRESHWNLRPVVRRILTSRLLLAHPLARRRIASPVELAVGWLRALETHVGPAPLAESLGLVGQSLFHPPNVKGWPGGRSWLNSATVIGRANLLGRIAREAAGRDGPDGLAALVDRHGWRTPEELTDGLALLLFAEPLDDAERDLTLRTLAGPGDRTRRLAAALETMALFPSVNLT